MSYKRGGMGNDGLASARRLAAEGCAFLRRGEGMLGDRDYKMLFNTWMHYGLEQSMMVEQMRERFSTEELNAMFKEASRITRNYLFDMSEDIGEKP